MIGLILLIPRFLVNQVVMGGRPVGTEAQALIVSAIDILVSTPFAYVAAGIVLGAVGARESIRRSWRLSAARWRLALLIGIVNTAVTYLAGFAVGAGGDILVRLGTAFGLGAATGPAQIVILAAIVAVAIVSIGSLTMTIGALTVGPQIVIVSDPIDTTAIATIAARTAIWAGPVAAPARRPSPTGRGCLRRHQPRSPQGT